MILFAYRVADEIGKGMKVELQHDIGAVSLRRFSTLIPR